jgi:1,4-alpha-glucan branching enzyme
VHGKGSLLGKMPGDDWQRRANLRALLGYMYLVPGKKLLFMGGELGQYREWNHDATIEWQLLGDPAHHGIHRWVRDLNHAYGEHAALHELDCDPAGFEWAHTSDAESSVLAFLRRGRDGAPMLAVFNLTPIVRPGYAIGVPAEGQWRELLNSDAEPYGGSGVGNLGGVASEPRPLHGREHSVQLVLPPLSCVLLGLEESA